MKYCGSPAQMKPQISLKPRHRRLSKRRLRLREQAAEAGEAWCAGRATDALEGGPQHRLVGIDDGLAGLPFDRLDRLDLGRVGATQEEAIGRHLRELARKLDPARDRDREVIVGRWTGERHVMRHLDSELGQ